MKYQLLCTFTHLDRLPTTIGYIHKNYNNEIENLKCYAYVDQTTSIVCIYNAPQSNIRLNNTITINRKKETNTLYSINALNNLIKLLNNGILDKTYVLNWTEYTNTIILSEGIDGVKKNFIKELA